MLTVCGMEEISWLISQSQRYAIGIRNPGGSDHDRIIRWEGSQEISLSIQHCDILPYSDKRQQLLKITFLVNEQKCVCHVHVYTTLTSMQYHYILTQISFSRMSAPNSEWK